MSTFSSAMVEYGCHLTSFASCSMFSRCTITGACRCEGEGRGGSEVTMIYPDQLACLSERHVSFAIESAYPLTDDVSEIFQICYTVSFLFFFLF